jgi:Ca2+-binding EF-hand superfamily protein
MQKQFKIMDDNNSGNIDIQEFKKAVKEFRVELNE